MNLLTVEETAQLLRVNPMTVRRHIGSGRLPAVRAGRSLRIRREDLEAFMRPVTPGAAGNVVDRAPGEGPHVPGRPLAADDALWTLVGAAAGAPSTDASRKHEYLDDHAST